MQLRLRTNTHTHFSPLDYDFRSATFLSLSPNSFLVGWFEKSFPHIQYCAYFSSKKHIGICMKVDLL